MSQESSIPENPYSVRGLKVWATFHHTPGGFVFSVFDKDRSTRGPVYVFAGNLSAWGYLLQRMMDAPSNDQCALMPGATEADLDEWRASGEKPLGISIDDSFGPERDTSK